MKRICSHWCFENKFWKSWSRILSGCNHESWIWDMVSKGSKWQKALMLRNIGRAQQPVFAVCNMCTSSLFPCPLISTDQWSLQNCHNMAIWVNNLFCPWGCSRILGPFQTVAGIIPDVWGWIFVQTNLNLCEQFWKIRIFCSKLGPLFTIFGSPWDCVSVALSRHFLYLIHIWAFFGTILELSGTLSLFSWKWKCRYFHENGRKTCRTGKKGVALLHNGSPLGSPGPLGDLFGDLGPLWVPF